MATGLAGLDLLSEEEITATGSSESSPKTGTVVPREEAAANATGTIDNQYFFFEDEIFRIDHKGRVKLGLVIETAEMYSGDEDDVFDDVLNKSEVRVAWYPEGKEDVQSERAIGLADRTLMPGDVVRRLVTGTDTQRGYCREISMRADVKVLGSKYVIKNVLAERLRLIGRWQRDSAVCLDSWVGSTKDIEEKAVLRSVTGSRIEVTSVNFFMFKEVNSRSVNGVFNRQIFYPGNVVVGRLPSMENVKLLSPKVPLPTNKKGKPLMSRYTIESVYTDAVWVHWQCKALSEEANIESSALQQPSPCVTGEDLKRLKRLNLFESCMLQINDRNYLKYSQCDTLIKKSEWDKEQAVKFKLILSEQQKQENQNLFVHTGGGSTNSTHHFEKLKKKLNLLDADKSSKSKKFALKVEKLGNSSNKEKSQNHEPKTSKDKKSEAGWISDEDDDEDEDDDNDEYFGAFAEDGISTTTTMSTCSSPSPRGSPKHLNRRQLRKKATKNLKKPIKCADVPPPPPEFTPKDGEDLVTEALLVYSTATVIWQDGTIEQDIPSTQLYPIHHLDNHEFFPGDFVISGTEDSDVSFRDYGVIQTVDHHGRTAHVKWFTTYTSADEPKPTHKGESEVSVYDLKDHPDFQYRPGTMVIRVANFVGEDATCTAGQIIDNFIDGRVKVWWVDGHISMCWPQDLFEVGQYDHADWGHESEDSWETESEHSEYGDNNSPKLSIGESHILANIDRARGAIARLEEIFNISPNLQNPEVMRKLLTVYKGCRYLDRLLNTCFFHEDNFMGLIERVRKVGSQTISERAQDRKNRLFSDGGQAASPNAKHQQQQQQHHHHQPHQQQCHFQAIVAVNNTQKLQTAANQPSSKEYAPKVLFNISSTPFKCSHNCNSSLSASGGGAGCATNSSPTAYKRKCSPVAAARCDNANDKANVEVPTSLYNLLTTQSAPNAGAGATSRSHSPKKAPPYAEVSPGKHTPNSAEKNQLQSSAMLNVEKASSQNDSGNCSRNDENCDGSNASSSDLTHIEANSSLTKANYDQKSMSSVSIELPEDAPPNLLCIRMCTAASPGKNNPYSDEKNLLLCSAMLNIEKAYEKTSHIKTTKTAASSQDDSGNYSRNENNCGGSSTSYASSSDLTNIEANSSLTKANDDQKSISCSSIELTEDAPPELVCVRLCALLKDQLIKCFTEIREKYYKEDNLNLSDVLDLDAGDEEEYLETILEINDVSENVNQGEASTATTLPSPKTPVAIEESPTVVSSPLKQTSPIQATALVPSECFQVLSNAPKTHKFHLTIFHPNNAQQYYRAIHREHRMLKSSLPPGVWIKVFEDRMDLLSVMIEGPKKTPYEDGMFFFDIQLGREYPKSPPLCHYISYCSDRLNPNLYEDGKVCVSLLGTWSGRDSEVWSANSTLLQVIVSIQGLILVSEPYFNEAGYEKQKGSQQGKENSRMYNEMVIIKMVLATAKLLQHPPEMFRQEILDHFKLNGHSMYERIKGWMEFSKLLNADKVETAAEKPQPSETNAGATAKQFSYTLPDFPLVPASRGFCLTLAGLLETFKSKIDHMAGVSNNLALNAK